jgi:tetratricopeptide (TPR) repeat protein
MSRKADKLLLAGQKKYLEGDYTAAEGYLSASLAVNPHQAEAWSDMALIAAHGNKVHSAIAMTERAILSDRSKSQAISYCNLGNMLVRVGKLDQAREALETAMRMGLDGWTLRINKGIMHVNLGQPFDAIEDFEKAFLDTSIPKDKIEEITTNLGYAYLMAGEFTKGLSLLTSIWTQAPKEVGALRLPQQVYWEPLKPSSRMLLFHNQGYGDDIQFARFIPSFLSDARAIGSTVSIAVPPPIFRLFSHLFNSDMCKVVEVEKLQARDHDKIFAISMLPMWCKTTLETLSQEPYIKVEDVWKLSLPSPDLKVGVVWSARQNHGTGGRRTIPFRDVLSLLTVPGCKFYGLQARPDNIVIEREGAQYLVEDLAPKMEDFYDLAAMMNAMDVIVSADTAPLHLAGAMGLRCVGLLSRDASDWRWLSHDRMDSPWYPGMKIVRQQTVGDWVTPIEQVKDLLRRMI